MMTMSRRIEAEKSIPSEKHQYQFPAIQPPLGMFMYHEDANEYILVPLDELPLLGIGVGRDWSRKKSDPVPQSCCETPWRGHQYTPQLLHTARSLWVTYLVMKPCAFPSLDSLSPHSRATGTGRTRGTLGHTPTRTGWTTYLVDEMQAPTASGESL